MRPCRLHPLVSGLDGWSPRGHPPLSLNTVRIGASNGQRITPELPPSKSHLIRWLLLAAQGRGTTRLEGIAGAADDACAMRDALVKLGVGIGVEEDAWVVEGVGVNGFRKPPTQIHCRNSGTALRLLTIAVTRIGEPIMLDGDESLRRRGNPAFWTSLGIEVSHGFDEETLPLLIRGPMQPGRLALDVSRTSQHLSALLLSMPAMSGPLELEFQGEPVSRRHAQLSYDLAALCGSPNTMDEATLVPWKCVPPAVVTIPRDASHVAFWKLYNALHGEVDLELPAAEDAIGAELLFDLDLSIENQVDLRDANDLITPLAAAMAVGGGGSIAGAAHAQFKESARIRRTVELLASFGLKAESTEDGLHSPGGQTVEKPASIIATHGDHRLQMTAVVLATKVGAEVDGADLHEVSFPAFLDLIQP